MDQQPERRLGPTWRMAVLERRIVEPFCMGEAFTAVDVLVHWQMWFCHQRGYLTDLPRAQAYVERLSDRLVWPD
ncbi:MAG: hypothetical protein AAGA48_07580 [Myxococcota bacterium]